VGFVPCSIEDALAGNSYPGRGIIIGRDRKSGGSVAAYFITGRSENSKNRVLRKTRDGVRVFPRDKKKLTNPELVIYNPVRRVGGMTVITNGNQTESIRRALTEGRTLQDALRLRRFEPDPPLYTPRISGLLLPRGGYMLSIIKSAYGNPSGCFKYYFEYLTPLDGVGHLIHTYREDGDPPESFTGEPVAIALDTAGGIEDFAGRIWNALRPDKRVAVYAAKIYPRSEVVEDVILPQ
jgi:IMP cyclohydrolase